MAQKLAAQKDGSNVTEDITVEVEDKKKVSVIVKTQAATPIIKKVVLNTQSGLKKPKSVSINEEGT